MISKHLYLIFFNLFLLSFLSVSVSANPTKKSPVGFLEHIEGCKKGDNVEGVLQLKIYMQQFGYLDYKKSNNTTHENDDDFDEMLESAIKTYQLNFHVNPTGVLDKPTLSQMVMPRCGVPDIINGTNLMKPRNSSHGLHIVTHYSFFPRMPKWPPTKTHLTFAFLSGTPGFAMQPVANAFTTWQRNTQFTFSRVQNPRTADLTIGFARGSHGDGDPFDGPGGTLAHAFAPQDGRFHYDGDERWVVGAQPNSFDLETVALHEIGHLLGLFHSQFEEAIMYPYIPSGETKGLSQDDIDGIKALYGV